MSEERLRVIFSHLHGRPEIRERNAGIVGQTLMTAAGQDQMTTGKANAKGLKCHYKFTLENPHLTTAQRKFYEHNGFLLVPNLVPHNLLESWRVRFLDLVEGRASVQGLTKMKDISLKGQTGISGERTVNKIQDFLWDECLGSHCTLPQILNVVECFTGPNIMAMHSMLINKPPDSGTQTSRHPMHQDLHYFPFRPAERIVCAWTAMERVNVDNGCLFVVPGSHRLELMQHEYPEWENGVNKMYHGVRGFDDHPKTLLEMEAGDTVFFHPLLLHGSGENRTQRFRKAISCHYAASECEYIDVRGTSQENIAKEVEEITQRRVFQKLDFIDIWKIRNRNVRGATINL